VDLKVIAFARCGSDIRGNVATFASLNWLTAPAGELSMDISQAKQDLLLELQKEQVDFSKVSELSDALVNLRENSVRFTVDAQHINRLGYELVGKQETALSELIKNAYDADATTVDIKFQNYAWPGGTLVIKDNGSGMTAETIKSTWMRLSTNDKAEHPKSPIFERPRAGRKGIGRFAVQRLGYRLTLESGCEGDSEGIRVTFNWAEQFKSGKELGQVWSELERIKKKPADQGTTLIISDLRDAWSDAHFDRAWKSVLFLQPPYPIAEPSAVPQNMEVAADGVKPDNTNPHDEKIDVKPKNQFEVTIDGVTNGKQTARFDLQNTFLNHALAIITGTIDESGKATFTLNSKRLGLTDELRPDHIFRQTGPVSLEARYFIYEAGSMSGVSQRVAALMGRQYGGIRIYRNNFRVMPYGEPEDDWLRLNEDVARRKILPAGNNYNFFGHVSLDPDKNPKLDETSSREGFVENEAFHELRKFARECIEWAVIAIAEGRKKKRTSSQSDYVSEKAKREKEAAERMEAMRMRLEEVEKKLADQRENILEGGDAVHGALAALSDVIVEVKDIREETAEELERSLEYENMLRILASLGISISMFGHEIKSIGNAVRGNISLLQKNAKNLKILYERDTIEDGADKIKKSTDRMFNLGGYIENMTSYTESRTLKNIHMLDAIETFVNQFRTYMLKQSIKIDVDVHPKDLTTLEMHASEIDSVLFNFTTNAVKAIRKAHSKNPKIKITCRQDGDFILLSFEDNGAGVKEDIQDRIFEPFFTTTQIEGDEISGMGTGLGLKIVSDIAASYGGTVDLVPASEGFQTRFDFRIRRKI
jgi:signal transduction histidine kinase